MNSPTPPDRPKLLIFDVNETLLDLSTMKHRMNEVMENEFAFEKWFSLLLQYSLVETVTGQYHDFSEVGKAVLRMTSEIVGKKISDQQAEETLKMIRNLPPHPDVVEGLDKLKDAGYKMITLTNSAPKVANEQITNAGLNGYFENVMSIEEFKEYKPSLNTYLGCIRQLGVNPPEAMLIAAHGWDVAGAMRAGLRAAFVTRAGKVLYPLAPTPTLTGKTLIEVAEKMVDAA